MNAFAVSLPALALAGLLGLSACSTTESTGTATTTAASEGGYVTPREMPDGKGSNAADDTFPRTVAHFQGSAQIQAAPRKVAVLSTGQADALLTLGIAPAGSTKGDGAAVMPQYLSTAYPDQRAALGAVRDLGSRQSPDLESIASLDPDLILVNRAGKDAASLYASLSEIAPTVVTQGTGLYWKQDFLLTADAVGKREAAQAWLKRYHSDAAAAGAAVQGSPTVSLLRRNGDRTRIFGIASFSGSVAEDMGLARPQSQSFTDKTSVDISAEQLDQADADRLLYGVQGGDATALTSMPLWSTLGAVSVGRAEQVDDDTFFLNTGPTAASGVLTTLSAALGR